MNDSVGEKNFIGEAGNPSFHARPNVDSDTDTGDRSSMALRYGLAILGAQIVCDSLGEGFS